MAEDRYPSLFPQLAIERSREIRLWIVDWARPDAFWDLQKPEFLFELWTLLAWFLGIGAEVWRDRDPA